jgi:biopolymer transport protein ExbB/TolQ
MMDFFYQGGPLFMGILTLIGFIMIALAAYNGYRALNASFTDMEQANRQIAYVRSTGLLALVVGILGQLIGLFSAFEAIEQINEVSPAMLAGGLKVSMITTLYGLVIFLVSLLLWMGISVLNNRKSN